MRSSGSATILVALILLSAAYAQEAVPPLAFVTLQEKYNNALVPVDLERAERKAALIQGYLTELEKLQHDLLTDGDMDGSAAAKAEKVRVADNPDAVLADAGLMPARVQKTRVDYLARFQHIDDEQDRRLETLREQYVRNLVRLERRLRRQGDLEGVHIVRDEKERMGRAVMKDGEVIDGLEPWTREWSLLQCWAPGNTVHSDFEQSWYEGDMQPGEYSNRPFCEGAGVRTGILEIHPVSPEEPAKMRFKGRLDSRTPTLVAVAGGCIQGDSLLTCIVNGEVLKQYVIDGSGWTICEFNLSAFINEDAVVELWNEAGGAKSWFYEHCYIDEIYFK